MVHLGRLSKLQMMQHLELVLKRLSGWFNSYERCFLPYHISVM